MPSTIIVNHSRSFFPWSYEIFLYAYTVVISWILKGNPVKISVVIPVEKLSPIQRILTILSSPVFQHHLLNPSWASLDFPYSVSDLLSSNTASVGLPVLFLVPAFFLVNRNSFSCKLSYLFLIMGQVLSWFPPCLPCAWWKLLEMLRTFLGRFGLTYNPIAGPWYI